MKIIAVERTEMSGVSISTAYTYLAYMETNLAELSLDDTHSLSPRPTIQRPLPTSLPSVSRVSLKNFKHHPNKRLYSYTDYIDLGPAGTRLDFLSHLPPEIAVYILRFLHPQYLCRYDLALVLDLHVSLHACQSCIRTSTHCDVMT